MIRTFALNLAINLLGAYVHTNRLQFVEFFGKFYEGGGKPFEPFKSDTKYVTIQERQYVAQPPGDIVNVVRAESDTKNWILICHDPGRQRSEIDPFCKF